MGLQTWIPYNVEGGLGKDGLFLLPNGGRRTGSGIVTHMGVVFWQFNLPQTV